jgi:hypothetical protein
VCVYCVCVRDIDRQMDRYIVREREGGGGVHYFTYLKVHLLFWLLQIFNIQTWQASLKTLGLFVWKIDINATMVWITHKVVKNTLKMFHLKARLFQNKCAFLYKTSQALSWSQHVHLFRCLIFCIWAIMLHW